MSVLKKQEVRHSLSYFIEQPVTASDFRGDVLRGLSARQPFIPPKYFYDTRGANLFEQICETREYYVTRAELDLLSRIAPELAKKAGPNAHIFEPGSGAAEKVRILLNALETPASYTLFDISKVQMERVAADINRQFGNLVVGAVSGDFTEGLPQDDRLFDDGGRRICFFPGGTLGNFGPEQQVDLLKTFRSSLRPGDALLLGVDAIKNAAMLDAAYNDAADYTAQFNLNLLQRLKTDLDAVLDLDDWRHLAFFDETAHRIRMFLRPVRETSIEISGKVFEFPRGRAIHTEDSWKFNQSLLFQLGRKAGFDLHELWDAGDNLFYTAWFEAL